jgi:hypothetical protein
MLFHVGSQHLMPVLRYWKPHILRMSLATNKTNIPACYTYISEGKRKVCVFMDKKCEFYSQLVISKGLLWCVVYLEIYLKLCSVHNTSTYAIACAMMHFYLSREQFSFNTRQSLCRKEAVIRDK